MLKQDVGDSTFILVIKNPPANIHNYERMLAKMTDEVRTLQIGVLFPDDFPVPQRAGTRDDIPAHEVFGPEDDIAFMSDATFIERVETYLRDNSDYPWPESSMRAFVKQSPEEGNIMLTAKTDWGVSLADVKVSEYEISLVKLVGKNIKDIRGWLTTEFGEVDFKVTTVVFEDDTTVSLDGEHDIAYLEFSLDEQPNLNEETLSRLYEEEHPEEEEEENG